MNDTPELLDIAARLGVAALAGLAVGVEREWSGRQTGEPPRFAGVRTFLLLGLLGGLAAALCLFGAPWLGVIAFAAGGGLVVASFVATARQGHIDATTEVAGALVLAAGAVAGLGQLRLASAVAALAALVLVEKSRLHELVGRIRSEELEAAFRFAVLALVVLPLLPVGPFGPGVGVRPREIWLLVLVFSGISFAGYLALRLAGPTRGYGFAGLLGGLVSSTAVTLNFARESRQRAGLERALALGVLAASTVLVPRVLVLSALLNIEVTLAALRFLAPSLGVGLVALALLLRHRGESSSSTSGPSNPLRLSAAVQLALAFQVVLYLMDWMTTRFGSSGTFATAFVTGLTDMDALTYSMTKLATTAEGVDRAARALGVGLLANTLFKLALALALGSAAFRRTIAVGLLALAVATGAALLVP